MPKYPCSFCKVNEATQFCDFVVDYSWTTAKNEQGLMIGPQQHTCDNQICIECSIKVCGYDFCPSCNELRKMIKQKHDERKGRLMIDIISGNLKD
ncbi:hypothetical protein [Priestia megaterium]|uniref:hypothetical protein n=1 Tax=Priestia megaterium TaxID=1404 RepID=UPI002E200BCB|nr:hypothetical protein [Priestia megaterium]